jgi:alpha-amylase/alpha-mannosidase (GH57 family)
MKHAHVCFLWHMHHPYYTDPVSGTASMPWVRLHASKAYFDMPLLLERFPRLRATFNLTPSLVLQLTDSLVAVVAAVTFSRVVSWSVNLLLVFRITPAIRRTPQPSPARNGRR